MHEVSDFNGATEVVASWILFMSLFCFVVGLYYFTVVRVPAKPILEKLFSLIAVPPAVQTKLGDTYVWIKAESLKQLDRGKQLVDKYVHHREDLKPLKTEQKEVLSEMRGTSEDMGAAIIGAPLEEETPVSSPNKLVDL
jgi:hypothetical protein